MYAPYRGLREPRKGQLGKGFMEKRCKIRCKEAVVPSTVGGYDLECIAKGVAWCVPFGFIPIVGVYDLLSLLFYLPLPILGLF